MPEWTKEKVETLSAGEVKVLRENAARIGRQDIVDLCNEEIARRRPARVNKGTTKVSEDHRDQYVCEFHFVCPNELNVTRNQDGTVWSGTWVVAQAHADRAIKYGAIIALHTSKAEPSYLEGAIIDWRKSPREPQYSGEQMTQTDEGIDFLFQPSHSPKPWRGDGSGEKGYAWAPLPK